MEMSARAARDIDSDNERRAARQDHHSRNPPMKKALALLVFAVLPAATHAADAFPTRPVRAGRQLRYFGLHHRPSSH
jgi:hypothetical protein